MGENSIRLAKQASLAIKSTFNSVSLRVVYNTNRPLNGIVKDATPTHDLSNVVYIFKCHCGNDYVGRTSQRFHVRREQHVTKKLKKFIDIFRLALLRIIMLKTNNITLYAMTFKYVYYIT